MTERTLSDSLISSESANQLTDAGERLFVRIIAAPTTDRWGRRRASLTQLKADCIPLLDWSDDKLAAALQELVEQEMVDLYTVAGRDYLAVTNWDRHQRRLIGLRRRHGQSRYPAPPDLALAGDDAGGPEYGVAVRSPDGVSYNQPSAAEEDLQNLNPTVGDLDPARARDTFPVAGETDWRQLTGIARFRALSLQLRGSDDRTPYILMTAARGLPEAAIHTALESLEQRRRRRPRLQSEARYLAAALTTMRTERQYA